MIPFTSVNHEGSEALKTTNNSSKRLPLILVNSKSKFKINEPQNSDNEETNEKNKSKKIRW